MLIYVPSIFIAFQRCFGIFIYIYIYIYREREREICYEFHDLLWLSKDPDLFSYIPHDFDVPHRFVTDSKKCVCAVFYVFSFAFYDYFS